MLGKSSLFQRSLFSTVPAAPADGIFGIQAKFRESTVSPKLSLTVGVLWGDDGCFYSFPSVLKAKALTCQTDADYLPMTGKPEFVEPARKLLFGANPPGESVQAVGGTGALFLAASMYKKFVGGPVIRSLPTWPNYGPLFDNVGLKSILYQHLDHTHRFNTVGLLDAIRGAPRESLVLLQQVGHNPTGTDLSLEQWRVVFEECRKRDHLLLFDVAYVGFVKGSIEADTVAMREYVATGRPGFVAMSFSKCMALYGDRLGIMTVLGDKSHNVAGHAEFRARTVYSVPPRTGADIASRVLQDPRLKAQWEKELKQMCQHLVDLRRDFVDGVERAAGVDWEHVRQQCGFFAWTGLREDQVRWLHSQGVFLPYTGRVTVPAVNPSNFGFVVEKIAAALKR